MASLFPMSSIITILLVLFVSSLVQSQSIKECDLISNTEITVDTDHIQYLNVLNLNENTKWQKNVCKWKISKKVSNSALDFSRIVLQKSEELKVENIIKKDNVSVTELLYSKNGTIVPGIFSINEPISDLLITLTLSNGTFGRTFMIVYYPDSLQNRLSKDSGLYSFPINNATNTTKILSLNFQFSLHPSYEYSDRNIMLSFYKFPTTYSFKMDNVLYTDKKPPPSIYLSNSSSILFDLDNYTLLSTDSRIIFRYWLVTSKCSQSAEVNINKPATILIPDETYRSDQAVSDILCAKIFTRPNNTNFELSLNEMTLANSGDSLSVYENGRLKLSIASDPSSLLQQPKNNYFQADQLLVIYHSPYSMNTNSKFVAPTLRTVQQDGNYELKPDSPISLNVDLSAKDSATVVHIVNVNQPGHNVIVQFDPSIKIDPSKVSIKIYDSVLNNANPIVVLGKFATLPSTIPSDSSVMRVEFTGSAQKQQLKVTYKAVDSSKSCNLISTVNPNFKVNNETAQQVCTWYIPETNSKYSMINPTFIDLPKGSNLTVKSFGDQKLNTYSGPINKFNLPDIALSGTSSYEFLLNTNSDALKDVKLLISKKADYLMDSVKVVNSSDVYLLQSTNYPGNYPIGLSQSWMLNTTGQDALITLQDIHLAAPHKLSFTAQGTTKTWSGIPDLNNEQDFYALSPSVFTLNAEKYDLDSYSNRGFNLTINYAGHGGLIDLSKQSAFGFNSSTANYPNHRCIWFVDGEIKGKNFSDTVLRINVTLGDSKEKTKAKLTIYDSITLRDPREAKINASNGEENFLYLSSVRSAIIVYDYSASISTKTNYSIYFNVVPEKCTNSYSNVPKKCLLADRCITDWIACNGVNDCGDWSDERFCNSSAPIPPPIIKGGGVNVLLVIFFLMPLSAILAIIGYIYIPSLLARIRRGRYSEFRNFSEVN